MKNRQICNAKVRDSDDSMVSIIPREQKLNLEPMPKLFYLMFKSVVEIGDHRNQDKGMAKYRSTKELLINHSGTESN